MNLQTLILLVPLAVLLILLLACIGARRDLERGNGPVV